MNDLQCYVYELLPDGTKIVAHRLLYNLKKQNDLNKELFPMLWQARLIDSSGYAYTRRPLNKENVVYWKCAVRNKSTYCKATEGAVSPLHHYGKRTEDKDGMPNDALVDEDCCRGEFLPFTITARGPKTRMGCPMMHWLMRTAAGASFFRSPLRQEDRRQGWDAQ